MTPLKTTEELIDEGWQFNQCPCGFYVITLPDGLHYCPRCANNRVKGDGAREVHHPDSDS